jgi:hypothetical protein
VHRFGRAIAQAVNRQLPTGAARVSSCGIYGEQSGTVPGFLRVLRFLLPIRIPPIAPQSSSIIWGWCSRPNSGRSTKWSQSHPMRKIKEKMPPLYSRSTDHTAQKTQLSSCCRGVLSRNCLAKSLGADHIENTFFSCRVFS